MDYNFYLKKFKKAASLLDKETLLEKQLEAGAGVIIDSVFLKLYKKAWMNEGESETDAKTKIFFSIWVNDKTIKAGKIFYNIHALKLRQLKGYSIASRDFAKHFRKDFKPFKQNWKNVSLNFGPLTLMEGWTELDSTDIENTVVRLANNFLMIDHLIDEAISRYKS